MGVDVRVRRGVAVVECLEKGYDLILLLSVRPSSPVVISTFCGTSGSGQQVTFSTVPAGQFPDSTGYAYTSRVL